MLLLLFYCIYFFDIGVVHLSGYLLNDPEDFGQDGLEFDSEGDEDDNKGMHKCKNIY